MRHGQITERLRWQRGTTGTLPVFVHIAKMDPKSVVKGLEIEVTCRHATSFAQRIRPRGRLRRRGVAQSPPRRSSSSHSRGRWPCKDCAIFRAGAALARGSHRSYMSAD